MNRIAALCALLLMTAASTTAYCKSVTFYADGAIVELAVSAHKGVLEIPLPSALVEGSLRVRPDKGTSIQRVDIVPAPSDAGKTERELDALLEQKNRLNDRLQALASREAIFTSAAKSQSGKAPRKTKANPEPMQSIRQGTEFAIAQLETVYTARRKTEQEIRRLDSKIAAAKNRSRDAEFLARIALSPANGKIMARYAVSGSGWTPRYDIYLNGNGSAQVALSGTFPGTFPGYLLQASPAALADSAVSRVFQVQPGLGGLARYRLAVTEELFGTGVPSTFSFEMKNQEQVHLPPGDANIYRDGEYVGRVRFDGLSSGRSKKIAGGR